MAADEDMELRDLLLETLEKRGVINRIKAELRASVYLALDEQEGLRHPEKPATGAAAILATTDGHLAASLVHDFLHSCNLQFTLSVLGPEAPLAEPLSREELCNRLGLEQRGGPLLLQLVHPPQQPLLPPAQQSSEAPSQEEVVVPEAQTQNETASRPEGANTVLLGGPHSGGGGSRLPPLSSAPRVQPSSLEVSPALLQPEKDPHSLQSTASLRKAECSGSEESVEEELSHLDDSSLSTTADDRTVDQTVSRSSDVEGCDYAEPVHGGR